VSTLDREAVELFLQEASENLQYLREYVSVLQDVEPRREDLERLYISAHTLSGTSASYGFPRFSEVAGKLAHVFQYALNAPLGNDLHGPLTEFLSDGISLLETDLLEISDTGKESVDDIAVFKERYRFAFPTEPPPLNLSQPGSGERFAAEDLHEPSSLQPQALTLMRCHWTTRCRTRSLSFSNRRRRSISRLSAIALFRWKATTIRKRSKTVSRHSHGKRFGGASRAEEAGSDCSPRRGFDRRLA